MALLLAVLTSIPLAGQVSPASTTMAVSMTGSNPFDVNCTLAAAKRSDSALPTGSVTFGKADTPQSTWTSGKLGTFSATRGFPVGVLAFGLKSGQTLAPVALTIGDVNHDGIPDVVAVDGLNTVYVALGNGDGTFKTPVPVAQARGSADSVFVADFDGDGRPDIFVHDPDAGIPSTIFHNNGNGTFKAAATIDFGAPTTHVTVVDMNGDGKPDVVYSSYVGSWIANIAINQGDGTVAESFPLSPPFPTVIAGPVVGDFNHDGKKDIAFIDATSNLEVWLGDGHGGMTPGFTIPPPPEIESAPFDARNLAVADVNGDGKDDLITSLSNGQITVYLNKGNGSFGAGISTDRMSDDVALTPGMWTGDLDHDGKIDLLLNDGYAIYFYRGNGDGTFQLPISSETDAGIILASQPLMNALFAVADLNGDGFSDVLVAALNSKQTQSGIGVFLNQPVSVTTVHLANAEAPNGFWLPGCSYGGDSNFASSVQYEHAGINVNNVTASPAIQPTSGTYSSPLRVTISDSQSGATVYYTTDGTAPTTKSKQYTGTFSVTLPATVTAMAAAPSLLASLPVSASYTPPAVAAAPVFSPAVGTYSKAVSITITDSTAKASIYYTLDGTTPTTSSKLYSAPLTIASTTTIKAIAAASGLANSIVATATYTINLPVTATPSFSVQGGTYKTAQTVSISDATANAVIYYTLDGSTPTANSTKYSTPIAISSPSILKAMAVAPSYQASAVASAAYVFAPVFSPAPGSLYAATAVTISAPGATAIYYTTDGSTPTTKSLRYSGPIGVWQGNVISALAVTPAGNSTATGTFPIVGMGTMYTYAGNGNAVTSGDGGQATQAGVKNPLTVAVDGAGNVYIGQADFRIRRVTPKGVITTVAGTGSMGYGGDGGPATAALISYPDGLVSDAAGNLYLADPYNNRVRKISSSGIITTYAGTGSGGFSGDGGQATAAKLNHPEGVALDADGNLYITDTYNHRVRKVTPAGIISTVAGSGVNGNSGDGGPATAATLGSVFGIAVDRAGNLFLGDTGYGRVRMVNRDGIISTVAGNGSSNYGQDGGPATAAGLGSFYQLAVDTNGDLLIPDLTNNRVRMVSPAGIISTVAGTGLGQYVGDGLPPFAEPITHPRAVAFDTAGNMYIAAQDESRVRQALWGLPSAATPVFSPVGGTYSSAQSVTLTDSTSGASIYYTTDSSTPSTSSTKYSKAITVSSSMTIKAMAMGAATGPSAVASATYTIIPQASAPAFSPAGGSYASPQIVTISSATKGANIYYTLDGSTPSTSSLHYSTPIAVSANVTIRAMAAASGYGNSAVMSAAYTLETAAPAFSPDGGTFGAGQLVSITSATPKATIYYTTDGSTPTAKSTVYSAPVEVASPGASVTIKAFAQLPGWASSTVSSSTYRDVAPPQAFTLFGSSITATGATLGAIMNNNGVDAKTWFAWGTSATALTSSTPVTTVPAASSEKNLTSAISGLKSGTTYYFQPVVSTVAGTSYGAVQMFKTK